MTSPQSQPPSDVPEITPRDVAAIKAGYDLVAPIPLRDFFAGMVLMSLGGTDALWEDIAEGCYTAADAMLRARNPVVIASPVRGSGLPRAEPCNGRCDHPLDCTHQPAPPASPVSCSDATGSSPPEVRLGPGGDFTRDIRLTPPLSPGEALTLGRAVDVRA